MIILKHNLLHDIFTIIYLLIKSLLEVGIFLLITGTGHVFLINLKSPYRFLIGLPLFLGGAGLLIGAFLGLISNISSRTYLKGMCVFCKR